MGDKNFDLVIRNARAITAADEIFCDIGIQSGTIRAMGRDLAAGSREIDAGGRYVTPGGIDAHCHLDQPMGDGSVMADDFISGTRSAACGGTTTVIPFAAQQKGHSLRKAVQDYHRRADGKAMIDYAFHLIVCDPTPNVLGQELPSLIDEGYSSFKLYMTYDDMKLNDRQILDLLDLARRERALAMIHAENTDAIAWLTERLELAGRIAPKYHAAARPFLVEREATHRAISLAELVDVSILIVHVSGAEAAEQIRWAQGRGLRIHAETCPQYLFLSQDDLDRPGHDGAKCICSPPPRNKENQAAIWRGLANGTFAIFSSDHAPFRFEGPDGKKVAGPAAPFSKIPNGIPGLETRLPLLFSEGVLKGRITAQQFVALTATNAARLYGLYPRKGSLMAGADADIVIWDTGRERIIRNEALHHAVDYTPYEGMSLQAWPDIVISRGDIVAEGGEPTGKPGRGQFLPCERIASQG